jgi:hypothetical protein
MLQKARGTRADGTSVQIFSKVQGSMRNPGMWNFQFDRKDGALARDWIDRQLLPHLASWFADAENGENGSLALTDLGAPVRQYATRNSHTTKSDTSGVQGSSMDAYLQAASAFVPTSVKGPHQPARKKGFRPKNSAATDPTRKSLTSNRTSNHLTFQPCQERERPRIQSFSRQRLRSN